MSSTNSTAAPAPLRPCHICRGESCVVIPSIATPQHLCLLHYYTTGAHHSSHPQSTKTTSATTSIAAKKKSSSLLVESQRMDQQLPEVQELFAEAFIELQREIGEESARVFQSAANAEDPLALLLDATAPSASASRSAISRPFRRQSPGKSRYNLSSKKQSTKQSTRQGESDSEGGFLREAVLPERLRKLQNPNLGVNIFASKYSTDSSAMSRKRSAGRSNMITNTPSNPYQQRRQKPTNPWNQILDSRHNDANHSKKMPKTKWEDIEKEMISNITSGNSVSSKKCTCGSTNVETNGSVTSRNNDMTKGEVWGMKDRSEAVVERWHCLDCGKTWNEQ